MPIRQINLPSFPGYLKLSTTMPGRQWTRTAARRIGAVVPDLNHAVLMVSTPWWLPVLNQLAGGRVCYDYIDHIQVHARGTSGDCLRRWDQALLQRSLLIFAVSEALHAHVSSRAPDKFVALLPNGVESEWITLPPQPPPDSLRDLSEKPIAGFIGALFEWVDLDLLIKTARSLPDVQFVIVGPRRRGIDLGPLEAQPNVACFPAQQFEQVPRWINAFDVALIPFTRDVVSEYADPLKLYEYLALGKPVVSSHSFGRPKAPFRVAGTSEAFAENVRSAIAERGKGIESRKAFAREHTWQRRAEQLESILSLKDAHR
jgi:glycosyltransferase involved in cell wall biosynthesis